MRIEILDSAEKDLIDGFKFYERQSRGLGGYFLDSLFSDIESLYLYAGIHAHPQRAAHFIHWPFGAKRLTTSGTPSANKFASRLTADPQRVSFST